MVLCQGLLLFLLMKLCKVSAALRLTWLLVTWFLQASPTGVCLKSYTNSNNSNFTGSCSYLFLLLLAFAFFFPSTFSKSTLSVLTYSQLSLYTTLHKFSRSRTEKKHEWLTSFSLFLTDNKYLVESSSSCLAFSAPQDEHPLKNLLHPHQKRSF